MNYRKVSFSGHDKFDCKIDWIIRGIESLNEDTDLFASKNIEKAIEKLGLGINMVKSLKYWLQIFDLISDGKLTKFGKTILEYDKYLETTDVYWLLHWNLIRDPERATLYYLFFTQIYLSRFTSDDLVHQIVSWCAEHQKSITSNTIKNDVDVFGRVYTTLLQDLDLIQKRKNIYTMNFNRRSNISNQAFAYILLDYIKVYHPGVLFISLEELQVGNQSLQKMLCMNENDFMDRIYLLPELTNHVVSYSENAGFRQLSFKEYKTDDYLEMIFT